MKTIILSTAKKDLEKASEIILDGGLVAFPTETVYGVGANAFDKEAINKIFIAKGRPQDNPLIAHISNINQLKLLSKNIPEKAFDLAKKFWPGPLTLILKKKKNVPSNISAGLDTIAIRMPQNKSALKLISLSNPLVAPSANLSGKPSPTIAEHVINDLEGRINGIINGQKCKYGLESTVIDLTKKPFVLLRPGAITFEELENFLGKGEIIKFKSEKEKNIVASPGMKYKHYSPKARVILIENNFKEAIKKIVQMNKLENICIIHNTNMKFKNEIRYKGKKDLAKNIFYWFRFADKKGFKKIIVKGVDEKDLGFAVMNRIRKASNLKNIE